VKVFRQDLLPGKCYTPRMTEQKTRPGRVIYHGPVPLDDPRYSGGWNYLAGKNLNLPSKAEAQPEEPTAKDQENAP
jgi:hypothetical protein